MALTDAQKAAVRRYAGYPLYGTTQPINEYQDTVYLQFGMVTMSLFQRLVSLSAEEETILVNTYLTPLALRESEIMGAATNLGTESAAVWKRNANEVAERKSLFNYLRREMCAFLGLPPGPGLAQSNTIVRG